MPRTRPPYPPEFRQQMVGLVRAGRKPAELTEEFGCTAQSIANWVGQAQRDGGERKDGLTIDRLVRHPLLRALRKPLFKPTGYLLGRPVPLQFTRNKTLQIALPLACSTR